MLVGSGVRLTELLAALSLGTDLGMGHPLEHVLRQSVLAVRLGERIGLPPAERQVVLHTSLLAWVGCHVDAYEQAKWFGDDRAIKHDIRSVDLGKPLESAVFVVRRVGAGRSLPGRARVGVGFLSEGRRAMDAMFENHWRAADALAERLGVDQAVRDGVAQTFERWDGKGEPDGARGERGPRRLAVGEPGRRGRGVPSGRRCRRGVGRRRGASGDAVRSGAGRGVR